VERGGLASACQQVRAFGLGPLNDLAVLQLAVNMDGVRSRTLSNVLRRRVMKISGVEVIVQFCLDMAKSKAWYEDFLGLEAVAYGGGLFALDGTALHLAPGAPGTGRGGTGVYFHVDDVDAAYQELRARGYTFNEEPYDIPVGRLVTLNDPDGNIVGLEDRSKGGLPVDG
jgi:lactoylglutathione lyase